MIFLILTSFLIWLWIFRGFLTGELALIHDALSYYDHIQFFIDNLAQGVYPLWDSFWEFGSPNEFFLRRIGESNPLLLLMLGLVKLGFSFHVSYFIFLSLYYLLACLGFYYLGKKLFCDARLAFTAFLLLMFSSLMTILFDSFIILIFTPIVWFFYFLIDFAQKPSRAPALGITFCLMLIVSTYIPFYFLTIFLFFVFSFCIFYFKEFKSFLINVWKFICKHKIFCLLALSALCLAFIPGVLYFIDAKAGEIAIPRRSFNATVASAVAVGSQPIAAGGIVTSILFKRLLVNLTQAQLGMFYFPIFTVCCLLLSCLTRMNKRVAFFLLWGGLVYLVSLYSATPIYPFLYEHVFFFKYFRNFQFFLWLLIIQLVILIAVEQFGLFLQKLNSNEKRVKVFKSSAVVVLHIALAGLLYYLKASLVTSYCVVLLSAGFFVALIWFERFRSSYLILPLSLLLIVVIQPIQTFYYLCKNSPPKSYKYQYEDRKYLNFSFERYPGKEFKTISQAEIDANLEEKGSVIYYGLEDYNQLQMNVYSPLFTKYVNHLFYLYDNVEFIEKDKWDYYALEKNWLNENNKVFVERNGQEDVIDLAANQERVLAVKDNSEFFKIKKTDVNTFIFDVALPANKFLVITDNYHSGWQASIDGQEVAIFKVNGSFKGIYLPKGQHTVVVRYKTFNHYAVKILFMLLFQIVFISLVRFIYVEKIKNQK